jgi:hypothetical protein
MAQLDLLTLEWCQIWALPPLVQRAFQRHITVPLATNGQLLVVSAGHAYQGDPSILYDVQSKVARPLTGWYSRIINSPSLFFKYNHQTYHMP